MKKKRTKKIAVEELDGLKEVLQEEMRNVLSFWDVDIKNLNLLLDNFINGLLDDYTELVPKYNPVKTSIDKFMDDALSKSAMNGISLESLFANVLIRKDELEKAFSLKFQQDVIERMEMTKADNAVNSLNTIMSFFVAKSKRSKYVE